MNCPFLNIGKGKPDTAAIRKILAFHDVRIVDDIDLPSVALLDNIKPADMPVLMDSLSHDWEVYPERSDYAIPDSRHLPGSKFKAK